MDRDALKDLVLWKNRKRRKPLVLKGARQTGKTWLLQTFAREHYENCVYINFDNNERAANILENYSDIDGVVDNLEILAKTKIEPDKTLIIFDEIQECPSAITSLKYFCEQRPELHVASAGSLLGLSIHQGTGFPVGKVNFLDIYPLSFREFLDASGNSTLRELVDNKQFDRIRLFASSFVELLKTYFVVGGMPEAVSTFISGEGFDSVREAQEEILRSYVLDITKHAEVNEQGRVLQTWNSLPNHLSQENKKFVFSNIAKGARARDYRVPIEWLKQSGMASAVPRVSKPEIPLSAYSDNIAFKMFMVDVGLLSAMSGLDYSSIAGGSELFVQFKGALTEQYVAQQLLSDCRLSPYYWSSNNSQCEIDFVVQHNGFVFAIEAKAQHNVRSKSLKTFCDKYKSVKALRFSLQDYIEQDWVINVPLYAIGGLWSSG